VVIAVSKKNSQNKKIGLKMNEKMAKFWRVCNRSWKCFGVDGVAVVCSTIIDPPMSFLVSLKKRFKSQNTKRVFFLVCFFHYFFTFTIFIFHEKKTSIF